MKDIAENVLLSQFGVARYKSDAFSTFTRCFSRTEDALLSLKLPDTIKVGFVPEKLSQQHFFHLVT